MPYQVPQITQDMRDAFRDAKPFPHIVIDNFLAAGPLDLAEQELRTLPMQTWHQHRDPTSGEMIQQRNKLAIRDARALGPHVREVMSFFSSAQVCDFFGQLTGIAALQSDPGYLGGGVHRIEQGGKLSVHADFNLHPESGKHRRLNALLYLNKRWNEANAGMLELWRPDMSRCEVSIAPLYNRMVVFRITDDAFHGHPEPWVTTDDYARLSFAFYYYTDDRPAQEKADFHWALWQERPERGW
jgi:Rps23 Pro-64 3,4-dihydroxylase Tpa1-like proline 4-hydroxylase